MYPQQRSPTPTQQPSELATVTVSSRLPDFWQDTPRLWFVQIEAILKPQKFSDEARFNLIVTKLGKDVIKQVSDILLSPPDIDKFGTLKTRLLAVYEESENRQLQKLLSEVELGNQKPSQLLRSMRDLTRGKIPDDTLNIMWQGHLLASVRAVLAVTNVKDLESLETIADKVLENTRPLHISEIASEPTRITSEFAKLQAQIAQLSIQVVELQRFRDNYRNYNNYRRQRSSSRARSLTPHREYRDSTSLKGVCFYHNKYRHRARKCTEPCNWNNRKPTRSNNSEN